MTQYHQKLSPALEIALTTWYTRSWGPHDIQIKLLDDFPPHHPEPTHIFFDRDVTPTQVLARDDHDPWFPPNQQRPTKMALVVRRWGVGLANEAVVGMSWYL